MECFYIYTHTPHTTHTHSRTWLRIIHCQKNSSLTDFTVPEVITLATNTLFSRFVWLVRALGRSRNLKVCLHNDNQVFFFFFFFFGFCFNVPPPTTHNRDYSEATCVVSPFGGTTPRIF